MVSHSGGMVGVQTLLSFLPAMDIGVFIAGNTVSAWQNMLITQFVFDIALGLKPILDLPTACNSTKQDAFNDPFETIPDQLLLSPKHISSRNISAKRPLPNYTGTYGNFGYGNITITLGSANNTLELSYGTVGRFRLIPTTTEDEFESEGIGSAWVFNIGILTFAASDNSTGVVDELNVPTFEPFDPPTFIRDLKMTNAPPPPTDNC